MALNITKKPLNIIVFIYDINDLHLRESRRDTINASEADAAVWEHSRVRQLYRNTLTTDFPQAFRTTYRCCERDDLIIRLVKLSRLIAQSHMTFLMRMEEFIR